MRTVGHLILMAVICVAVFIVFIAIRPARAWSDVWRPTPGDGSARASPMDWPASRLASARPIRVRWPTRPRRAAHQQPRRGAT